MHVPEAGFGYINAIMFSFVTIIIAFVASVKRKKLLIDRAKALGKSHPTFFSITRVHYNIWKADTHPYLVSFFLDYDSNWIGFLYYDHGSQYQSFPLTKGPLTTDGLHVSTAVTAKRESAHVKSGTMIR